MEAALEFAEYRKKVYWIINGRLLLEGKAVYTVTTGMVIQ
jgi:hypothetical protein